jgi:hypothetical protein
MTQYDRNEDIYEPNRAAPPERGSNAVVWTLGLLGVAIIAGLVLFTPRDNTQTTSTPPSTTTAPSTTGSAPAPAPRPTTPTPSTPR